MADGDIKTEISRNELANADDNVIFIAVTDDAGNVVSVTNNALDVNATVTLETAYVDNSTEFVIDVSEVNAQGFLVDEVTPSSVTEGRIGLARMSPERVMLQIIVDDADNDRRLVINADGSINTNPAKVSSGTEVHDHNKTAATAKDAVANHDYVVANTTFLLKRVSVSGTGRIKTEVRTGTAAEIATDPSNKLVLFKKRDETVPHVFDPAIPVPSTSTGTVRLVHTQRSVGSLFMYSTIEGEDI